VKAPRLKSLLNLCAVAALCGTLALPVEAELNSAAIEPAATVETKLTAAMNNWLARGELQNSQVGVEIMHLPSGRVLFSSNGNKRFVPASVAKVITCACAIDESGPETPYLTELEIVGEMEGDTLRGDVLITASQDPTLEYRDIQNLLAAVKVKSIKRIIGSVKIIAAGFDHFSPGWLTEDWGQEWMPVSSGLVIDRNIAPSADPGRGMSSTIKAGTEHDNALLATLLVTPDLAPGWATYDSGKNIVQAVRGTGSSGLVITNPSQYHKALITAMLKSMGIHVEAASGSYNYKGNIGFARKTSVPLSAIVRHTLRRSDNLYAQQILRTIGVFSVAHRLHGNNFLEACGLQEINDWLSGIGVKPSEVVLVDGCGLSRKNCVSPHSLNLVLKHMAGRHGFLELLRVSGSPSTGEFHFKTGTMDSVRTICGVFRNGHGDQYCVTAMVNGHTPSIRDLGPSLESLTDILQTLPSFNAAGAESKSVKSTPAKTIQPKSSTPVRRHSRTRRRRH